MSNKKVILGQFFTINNIWLKKHILEFIKDSKASIAYDPFAGNGDLLQTAYEIGFKNIKGLDIDSSLGWEINDSLIKIPILKNSIIITNPPYLSNYSASRKKFIDKVNYYFKNSFYNDLYLIALEKMMLTQNNIVALIPESFINSNFKHFNKVFSITILEDNPFNDTSTPICVVCIDNKIKSLSDVLIYKNDKYINNLMNLNKMRIEPKRNLKIEFNSSKGWLGLRAVDTTSSNKKICFFMKEKINYDWNNKIKISSRLITSISIDVSYNKRKEFIKVANKILNDLRISSQDVILTPFKGNMNNGERRRRLDYRTARAILEKTYRESVKNMKYFTNLELFNIMEKNPEKLDYSFSKEKKVITDSKEQKNQLMESNEKLIKLITTYEVLTETLKKTTDDNDVDSLLNEMIKELKTESMNYSAFSQFFFTYDGSYSVYKSFNLEQKKDWLIAILDPYIKTRHKMYLSHGYSNIVLQVLSDSYSHKRNSKKGIEKVESKLKEFTFLKVKTINDFNSANFCYILPDKGDSKLFSKILIENNIEFKFSKHKQDKLPDLLIKINNEIYIIEHKHMKENGGGQDKQITEIIDFIRYSEKNDNVHYITYLEGLYSNQLISDAKKNKNSKQYNDILEILKQNPNNYFLNTVAFEKFLKNRINLND